MATTTKGNGTDFVAGTSGADKFIFNATTSQSDSSLQELVTSRCRALLFALSIGLISCGGGGEGDSPAPASVAPTVARVVVTPANASIEVGKSVTFQAQALDASGATVAATFTWESSDTGKAIIDSAGVATGVASGAVNITASAASVRSTAASLAVTTATGEPSLNSFEKIDEALKSGAIDEATAIVYKMFATFKDDRLPAQYQGDDTDVVETDAFDLVYARWATLSDATKETLEPFLVPPAYAGSWTAHSALARAAQVRPQSIAIPICRQPTLDPNWAAEPATAGGRVKVWYDTRVADAKRKAAMLVTEFETRIWPTLVDTVGMKAPLSDAALTGCNGGDGQLDVYLVDMAVQGQNAIDHGETFPVQFVTQQHPVFILLSQSLGDDELKASAAHEFMHASQWAYPVAALSLSSYKWLKESTAQWGIDAVYGSTLQVEQSRAPHYMDSPDFSLETEEFGADRTYGSYLFFQFLARTIQRPGVVADVWNATAAEADQVLAVDKTIPGAFKEQWPKFAKLLWNQDPVNGNSFASWDGLMLTPTVRGGGIIDINLGGQGSATQKLDGNIKHLATHYYHFRVNDPNVRSMSFYNHLYAATSPPDTVTTQVFFKKAGSIWQYEHWSDEGIKEAVKSFCLDLVTERIEELVIAISNAHPTEDILDLPDLFAPRISVSNIGCWRYHGTASVTENVTSATGTYTSTADGSATFERWRPPEAPDGVAGRETFAVVSAAVTGNSTSNDLIGCTLTRRGNGQMPAGIASGSLDVMLGVDVGTGTTPRTVFGSAVGGVQTHTEYICPEAPPVITDGPVGWHWLELPSANEMNVEVKPDGTISGSYTRSLTGSATGTRTMIWNFTPQRQP